MAYASRSVAATMILLLGAGCAAATRVREDCQPLSRLPPGAKPPAEKKPGCFASWLRMPDSHPLIQGVHGQTVAQWAVCSDGSVGQFSLRSGGDYDATELVRDKAWRAVQACEWVPGRDAAGNWADMWIYAPLDFGAWDDPI
jgi:hypothetical protein